MNTSMRALRTFVAVATEGSFAAAAPKVALTQAAVGLQMRTLEQDMRRPLFERQGKSVQLNAEGRALLPQARHLLALYEQMRSSDGTPEALHGTLHLGAVVSAVAPLLQATLALKKHHPGLDLHVRAAKSTELSARVLAGELDAAVTLAPRAGGQPRGTLQWTPLYDEPMVLLASRQDGNTPLRPLLRNRPFIRFDRGEHTGELVERTLRRLRAKPTELIELNSIETMVELVRAGLGVTLLPLLRNGRWAHDPQLRVLALPASTEARRLGWLQARLTPKSAALAAVLQALGHTTQTAHRAPALPTQSRP